MQLGRSGLTPAERQCRLCQGLCLYCGGRGHCLAICPALQKGVTPPTDRGMLGGGRSPSVSTPVGHCQVKGKLQWALHSLPIHILVNSGTVKNFIDTDQVQQFKLLLVSLPEPKQVLALDGCLMAPVTNHTAPLSLSLSGNHTKTIKLFVIPSPNNPVVLGLSWLKCHNPTINWATASITSWSSFYHQNFLKAASPTMTSIPNSPLENIDLLTVPKTYHDLRQDLAKTKP